MYSIYKAEKDQSVVADITVTPVEYKGFQAEHFRDILLRFARKHGST